MRGVGGGCGEGEEVWVRGVCRWRMCGECEEVWVRGVGEGGCVGGGSVVRGKGDVGEKRYR